LDIPGVDSEMLLRIRGSEVRILSGVFKSNKLGCLYSGLLLFWAIGCG
jgi:hypothetical protein